MDNDSVSTPAWCPTIRTAAPPSQHRSLWLCRISQLQSRRVSVISRNVWSFAWAGAHHALTLVSESPAEAWHKESTLVRMDLSRRFEQVVGAGDGILIGQFTSTSSGSHVAVVELVGSEQVKIIGNLALFNASTQQKTVIDSKKVDVGCIVWMSKDRLLAVGLRDIEAGALEVNTATCESREIWSTTDACGNIGSFPRDAWVPSSGFAVVRNNWMLPPEIGLVDIRGNYKTIVSFDHDGCKWVQHQLGDCKTITWQAPDGLDIHGLLYLPLKGSTPCRTVLNIHGGPFSAFADCWLGYGLYVPWLVANGYAVFCPNPRGSVGRGAEFASAVKGDIGGMDAQDLLSGVDHLVEIGLADPNLLGLVGGSYGGYMTLWLVTQTTRFPAAVACSPARRDQGQMHTTRACTVFSYRSD